MRRELDDSIFPFVYPCDECEAELVVDREMVELTDAHAEFRPLRERLNEVIRECGWVRKGWGIVCPLHRNDT